MLNEHETEELLRRSNPEPDTESLRMEASLVRASAASIMEGREVMSTSLSQPKPLGKPRWSRAVVIATSAAAAVVVVVGGFALLARTGSDEIAPAAPAGEASLLEGTWERTVLDELGRYVEFEDLEATSIGLVAAAVMDGIWISKDGVAWNQALTVPYEPSSVPPETAAPSMTVPPQPGHVETYVRQITEHKGALYATGGMAIGQDAPDGLETHSLVWRSEDGVRWDEITLESAYGATTAHLLSIVAAGDALIVSADDGSIYYSEDGESFVRFGPEETGIINGLSAVVPRGDGFVGITEEAVGETDVTYVVTSRDGIVWSKVAESEFPTGHHPWGPLVEFDGALYVGGLTFLDDAAGAVWRSIDGESFALVDLGVRAPFGSSDDEQLVPMYGVEDLIVTPHGMLVVGHVPGESGNHQDIVMLATDDGTAYEPVSDPEGLFTEAIQTAGGFFNGRIVIVGHAPFSEGDGGEPYQWVWTP